MSRFRRIGLAGALLLLAVLCAAAALALASGSALAQPPVLDPAPRPLSVSVAPQELNRQELSGVSAPFGAPAIVGGQSAVVTETPWQLRLTVRGRLCGAVLVHSEWALTAAHCLLEPDGSPTPVQYVALVAADPVLNQIDSGQQMRTVAEVVYHPSFNPITRAYDVALVHLHHPYSLGPDVQPLSLVELPADAGLLAPGRPALVSGWAEGADPFPNFLYRAAMRLVDASLCAATYAGLDETMLCAEPASAADGGDVCPNDDGGPLVAPTGSGGYKLAGIAGVRSACGQAGAPSVFIAAAAIEPWVSAAVFTTAQPIDGPANAISSPGFETGPNGEWSAHSTGFGLEGALIRYGDARYPARTGAHMVLLGGTEGDTTTLTQTVAIPAAGGVLHYHFVVRSLETVCGDDTTTVGVNEFTLAVHELCVSAQTLPWVHHSVSVPDSVAGQTVTLWVRVENDVEDDPNVRSFSAFYLDDVRLAPTEAGAAAFWLSTSRLDFGGVPLGEGETLLLAAQSTAEAPVAIHELAAGGDFAVVDQTCPAAPDELAAEARCLVAVRYTPSAVGAQSGALVFETSAGRYSVELAGRGVATDIPTMWVGETDQGRGVSFRVYRDAAAPHLVGSFSISACLDGAVCERERSETLTGLLDLHGDIFHVTGDTYSFSGRLLDDGRAEGTYAFWSWNVMEDGPPARFGRWSAAPLPDQQLSVTLGGAGGGEVRSSPAGIVCGSQCSAGFRFGAAVTLNAVADADSLFTGWGGACSGEAASCVVTMDRALAVSAGFEPAVPLEVEIVGLGAGEVVSDPPGIACGAECEARYPLDTEVILTAVPAEGNRFVRWAGACSGQAVDCRVELAEAVTAVAEFAAIRSNVYLPAVQR